MNWYLVIGIAVLILEAAFFVWHIGNINLEWRLDYDRLLFRITDMQNAWSKERGELLDRLQSRDLSEYKHLAGGTSPPKSKVPAQMKRRLPFPPQGEDFAE